MKDNSRMLLAWIKSIGGGYVWEPEVFAVTLLDVPISEEQAKTLCTLEGVQQLALDARNLSAAPLEAIARMPGLESLVLLNASSSPELRAHLANIGPEVEYLAE